eukprot:COSAG06_NODE_57260_length_281_cov_0.571429_1_plen_46_part_10
MICLASHTHTGPPNNINSLASPDLTCQRSIISFSYSSSLRIVIALL